MFLYGSRFNLLDPRTYEWLQDLVETVVARTVRGTDRYKDDFALRETDPAASRAPAVATALEELAAAGGDQALFSLFQGLPVSSGQPSHPPTPPAGGRNESVFEFAGDGPPQTATNTVAEKGRRLRRRRWSFWSVVALLMVAFWVYNEYIGPWFGLPVLHR
jgi:hypothetical protein